jgi:hypothetical protein
MRLQTAWLLAALFGAGVAHAAAPPPGLAPKPYPPQSTQVQEAPTGSLLFGVGVNSDAGLSGSIVLSQPAEDGPADDGWECCPLCAGLESCWRALVHCFMPAEKSAAEEPSACPYLKKQGTAKASSAADAVGLGNSVLDNLERLTKAHQFYRKAEHYRRTGRFDTACEYYERAQQVCPGSRFDHLAEARLREVYAERAAEAAHSGCEEQEVLPMPHKVREPELLPMPHAVPAKKEWQDDSVWLHPTPPVDPETILALDRLLNFWSCTRGAAGSEEGEENREYQIQAEPPGLQQSFHHIESEEALGERTRQEADWAEFKKSEGLLRRILEMAGAGRCAEMGASSPEGVWLHCQGQIGSCFFEMTITNGGSKSLSVGQLRPGKPAGAAEQK